MVSVKLEACPTLPERLCSVKLISGQISHRNDGSQVSFYLFTLRHFVDPLQFAHPASIFTVIFLAITAVTQILCLNRGLRFYDSTLVVPVFYGVVGLSAQPIASAHRILVHRERLPKLTHIQ
jgi:hypothetical protein